MIKEKTKKRGRPSKSELKRRKRAEGKDTVIKCVFYIGIALLLGIFIQQLSADQIVHKFKNPSFSGIATSSHWLTIENQEFNRKEAIKIEIKAYREQLERDKENTTLAKFLRNLESRIYAQLSRQLVDNLFGENSSTSGVIELLGNTIQYTLDEVTGMITLIITDSDGNTTSITLPIGSFTF
jgi:hypothetical protein